MARASTSPGPGARRTATARRGSAAAPARRPSGRRSSGAATARRPAARRSAPLHLEQAGPELTAEDGRGAPALRRSDGAAGLLDRLAALATDEVRRRIPRVDLDERDPDYIRERLPSLWLLSSLYFRGDVRGLDNIPEEGPVLLVGNHSGGNVIADTFVFTLAFSTRFGVERRFHQLAHNLVLALSGVFPYLPNLRKFGTVAASHENAERALDAGAAVLVYPGGDWETHRPSWQSDRVDFAGRKGFIRLAMRKNVPIVPVVSIGGQETALFLSRGERLARLLGLDRMFRLKVLPISLALPWGLNVSDMALHLPLPAKISIEVLPPIHLSEQFGRSPDVDAVYDHIVGTMQATLTDMASRRRFPVIG